MILANIQSPLEEILDRPWRIGGEIVPWMSSQIAAMILVGLLLAIVLPLLARRRRGMLSHGAAHVVEMLILFVRSQIVTPAMGTRGRAYVPFLATLLVFLLGCNLVGLIPLLDITSAAGLKDTPIGGTPTGSIYVCGALAAMSFVMLLLGGYWQSVKLLWKGPPGHAAEGHHPLPKAGLNLFLGISNALQSRRWPLPAAVLGAVPVWLNGFAPPVPGIVGLVLWPLLVLLDLIGYLSKCVALCIRLFANMTNGHLLLAVALLAAAKGTGWAVAYVSLPSAAAGVLVLVLDLLVSVIHAYIFTFLTALYIGLAVYPRH